MTAYPFNKEYQSVQELVDSGKLKSASELPAPIPALHVKACCHQCERETGTAFKHTKAGIGNACSVCGCFRKGNPYISKVKFNALKLTAKGGHDDERSSI